MIANMRRKETYDFAKKDYEIYDRPESTNHNENQQEKKKRKRNKHFEVENHRKCSDTSLEATPEKYKAKRPLYR